VFDVQKDETFPQVCVAIRPRQRQQRVSRRVYQWLDVHAKQFKGIAHLARHLRTYVLVTPINGGGQPVVAIHDRPRDDTPEARHSHVNVNCVRPTMHDEPSDSSRMLLDGESFRGKASLLRYHVTQVARLDAIGNHLSSERAANSPWLFLVRVAYLAQVVDGYQDGQDKLQNLTFMRRAPYRARRGSVTS